MTSNDRSDDDLRFNLHKLSSTSSSSHIPWLSAKNTTTLDSTSSTSSNGDHNDTAERPVIQPLRNLETLPARSTPNAQNISNGTSYGELPPPPPSRLNKGSPPPYDQALLNHQLTNAQQISTVPILTGSPIPNVNRNGIHLQQQLKAASDAVQTLSQLNSTTPTSASTPFSDSSQLLLPILTPANNAPIPHGDYHIASFTKPIPTSSYISSTSSDAALSQYKLPQINGRSTRSSTSPPLPSSSAAIPTSSNSSSTSSIVDQSNSFTNTFLRGILTSIDSKDPVVANAWLETLLDAIDLLPSDVIQREIVVLAVRKGQPSQSVSARKSSCRLLGKIATKLDQQLVRQEVLPTSLLLCQDIDEEVRYCMCRHLSLVSCGIGLDATKATILPQLVELCDDKHTDVRLAAIETVVQLLGLLDGPTCKQVIIPLVTRTCEQARQAEDETLVNIAHYFGRLCYGLMTNLSSEQKTWFIEFYQQLATLSLQPPNDNISLGSNQKNGGDEEEVQNKKLQATNKSLANDRPSSPANIESNSLFGRPLNNTSASPMPDLVSMLESTTTNLKSEIYTRCRYECAYNFPAMVLFAEAKYFSRAMQSTFISLSSDSSSVVRSSIASSLHELAKIIGANFDLIKNQIVNLFSDNSIEVLENMVANMVHIIDALARSGNVLQFGQGGHFSTDISNALVSSLRLCIYRISKKTLL